MRPTPAELRAAHGSTVPDLVGPGVCLLVVGINPGLWSGATGAHFARPGNRFFPALHAAGLTGHSIDASAGLPDADRAHLLARGLGITAYRTAFRRPRATAGRQPETLAGAELWVVPNPSGLNAHETVASLAAAFAEAATAAGIDPLED